jgi:hypothetical protein
MKYYKLRSILIINKTNVKDILEIKYPMLPLAQIKPYLQDRGIKSSEVLFINDYIQITPIKN